MPASFPISIKTFSTKTDGVNDVMAVDINGLQDEVVAIETALSSPGTVIGNYQALHELRGFWPFSSVNENAGVVDLSGQGRTLTNYAPRGIWNNWIPYAALNGSSQYLTRADEAGLDITGNMTVGCWVRIHQFTDGRGLVSKDDAVSIAGSAFNIQAVSGGGLIYRCFGAVEKNISVSGLSVATWTFIAGRFTAATEVALIVNATKTANTTAIIASLNNVAAPFNIGNRTNGASCLYCDVALPFLCAAALPDALLASLYQGSRGLFGV